MNEWSMKPIIYTGSDVLCRLSLLENEKICFVCDPYLLNSENMDQLMSQIPSNSEITIFSDIVPDPPIEIVALGTERMIAHEPTVLVALGGGSALDTAKGMIFTYNKITGKNLKRFIAIPTTSGTGSEVTSASVITDNQNKIKYPIFHESLIPDEALLSAELVVSSPQTVTAYSGMDVLTHSLEALVATGSTTYTDALAEKSIEIVFNTLDKCYADGKNLSHRNAMHEASTLAGLAFDTAGLGVCHALAHQIGARFKVPHGLANTMLLPYVIEMNSSKDVAAREKYAWISIKLGVGQKCLPSTIAVSNFKKSIQNLSKKLNCPQTLSSFGVDKSRVISELDEIIRHAKNDVTYKNNPIQLSDNELKKIVEKII